METLREKAEKYILDSNYDHEGNVADLIDLMVGFYQSQNQWIPVSERLPNIEEVGEKVMLYRTLNEGQNSMSFTIHDTRMVKYCTPNETWWQTLPTPPKKGE